MKTGDTIRINRKEDFLKCLRNELVPENPVTGYGIRGLLEYRTAKLKRHVDSIYEGYDKRSHTYYGKSITAEYFEKIYGAQAIKEQSSDTIFNCWSFLNRFLRGKTGKRWVKEDEALSTINELFKGHAELKELLDKLADYQHCLANLMPAPRGFNGSTDHDGKGNFNRDNDYPDLYYQRARFNFPEMYSWINKNMDNYALWFFKSFQSNLLDGEANKPLDIERDGEIEQYQESIRSALTCIEQRAELLLQMIK